MKITRIAHIAVAAKQMEPIKAVFGDLFNLPVVHESRLANNTEVAMYGIGEMHIEVLHNPSASSITGGFLEEKGSGYFHICLEVENLEAALAELTAKGVKLHEKSPRKGVVSSSVVFLDPATTGGLLIELAEGSHAAGRSHGHGQNEQRQETKEINHGK